MSAPPWGHKPPAVNRYAYWERQPPTPSPRLAYWLRRLDEGSWRPNRRFHIMGYDESAEYMGIYMWEYLHVVYPAVAEWCKANHSSWSSSLGVDR